MQWSAADVASWGLGALLGGVLVGFEALPALVAGPAERPEGPAQQTEAGVDTVDLVSVCAAAADEIRQSLVEAQGQLNDIRLEQAVARAAQLPEPERGTPWSVDVPPLLQGAVFTAQLVGGLAAIGSDNAALVALDCRESPCVAVVRGQQLVGSERLPLDRALEKQLQSVGYGAYEPVLAWGTMPEGALLAMSFVPREEGDSGWSGVHQARLETRQQAALAMLQEEVNR